MTDSLEKYINNIYNILDNLDDVDLGIRTYKPELEIDKSKELLKIDLAMFILYLSASDGEISYKEKEFINHFLELDLSTEDIKEIIRSKKIRSSEFESIVPLSVKMMVEADNKIVEAGSKNSKGNELMYDVFKLIGQAFIACDHDVDDKELNDFVIYLEMIKEYINLNSLSSNRIFANVSQDAKSARDLLPKYKPDITSSRNTVTYTTTNREHNTIGSAPWDTVYYNYPCPYCGKYKVRSAKWDDKAFSAAFWGVYSYKLHCRFKCDNCKEMWN